MDTFFCYLKKTLVATMFVIFGLVATYTPQDWNRIQVAEAGGLGGGYTSIQGAISDAADAVWQTVSTGYHIISAWAEQNMWMKDTIFDGIAWAIAKAIVSSLVQSLVNWINSGFKGSPMFVQDLKKFLVNMADEAIGNYISELGGIGSLICAPFKLDIQIAVALEYQKSRTNQQTAPKCTLTGVIKNIEGFIDSAVGSFDQGGWEDWFSITSQPSVYTPYGAELAAKSDAYVRILDANNKEVAKINWGAGFLSGEICEMVHGNGTSQEDCFISKPGKIIEEALSFNLDSGRQSLIAADEINEIIGALLGQLAKAALTGVAGLLGLSDGTGYSYSGYSGGSYLSQMSDDALANTGGIEALKTARQNQLDYQNLALEYQPKLVAFASLPTSKKLVQSELDAASSAAEDTITIVDKTTTSISKIDILITNYSNTTNASTKADILAEFNTISVYQKTDIDNSKRLWDTILASDKS